MPNKDLILYFVLVPCSSCDKVVQMRYGELRIAHATYKLASAEQDLRRVTKLFVYYVLKRRSR
jgi:hypothetical protein